MSVIAPCITVETSEEYNATIERLRPFTDHVHIDISDGQFAPVQLFDATQIWWPKEWKASIHAMVARPSEHIDALIKLAPDLVIFHAETSEDITPLMQKLKSNGIRAGVALLKSTVPAQVKPLIDLADHVMIFSGDLGKHGGKASMMQLEKVRLIRGIRPSIEIGWDGGVTIDNAFSLSQGGIDVLNIGGEFSNSKDPRATYNAIVKELTKRSVI